MENVISMILEDVERYAVHGPMPYRILSSKYGKLAGGALRLRGLVKSLELQGHVRITIDRHGRTLIERLK